MEAQKLIACGALLLGQFYNIKQENGYEEERNLSKISKSLSRLEPGSLASEPVPLTTTYGNYTRTLHLQK